MPLNFVREVLGYDAWWDEASRTVYILKEVEEKPVILPDERTIDPVVSTEWLENNLEMEDLIVLDIRSEEDYEKGHIPGAVNVLAEEFWVDDELAMMMPQTAELFDTIGNAGITADSKVVVVGTLPEPGAPPYALAQATRVASTLIYAGLTDVAVLEGGHPQWVDEDRPVSTDVPEVEAVTFEGEVIPEMVVDREYVENAVIRDDSVIIDNRDADVYFGITIEPFAEKPGHIPTARSLPTPWMWDGDWHYVDTELLEGMASGVIEGTKASPGEVVIYCGVGGYASSWWYVLTQMLGYENVKIYDGSAQDWVMENDMVKFKWE